MKKIILLFSLLLTVSNSLYSAGSNVVILNSSNFQKEVINSDNIWLIEFYGKIVFLIFQLLGVDIAKALYLNGKKLRRL